MSISDTPQDVTPLFPDLKGKVAVVTGGSKGIGKAACRILIANGVKVAVVARDAHGIADAVSSLSATGGHAIGISIEATSYEQLERMRIEVETTLGPTDILMPFAGGFARTTPIIDITEDEWHTVIDANLTSTFLACKSFLPGMIERRRGAIVTMASNAARQLDVILTASYAAAKAGVVQFTRHVAKEVGPTGVRLNCIAPATILTERTARIMTPERLQRMADLSPMQRLGTPDDAAMAAVFLASESARWLTGITIDVSGGRVM